MYLGGNTPHGFHNLFSSLLTPHPQNKTFVIKGGPGVGKSTLMRRAAQTILQRGYDVEWMHCSGDPESVDGAAFPEIHLAIVDGTSPHIIDPKIPGAADSIINLGDCLNQAVLSQKINDIRELQDDLACEYKLAYSVFRAARACLEAAEIIHHTIFDEDDAHLAALRLARSIIPHNTKSRGTARDIFANAVTCAGHVSTVATMVTKKAVKISAPWGVDTSDAIDVASRVLFDSGLHIERCMDPLSPNHALHIIVPELDWCIITNDDIDEPAQVIDFQSFINARRRSQLAGELDDLRGAYDMHMEMVIKKLFNCKTMHDELESYYIDAMDFDHAREIRDQTLLRIDKLMNWH